MKSDKTWPILGHVLAAEIGHVLSHLPGGSRYTCLWDDAMCMERVGFALWSAGARGPRRHP